MNAHEAAVLFPLMDGVALQQLTDDVREHGLLEPIALLDGEILDGRNRLTACELAEVKPRFVDADLGGMSPVEYVVSHNLHRRHLTTGQRAALALDLLPRLEAEAKERQGTRTDLDPTSVQDRTEVQRSDEKAASLVRVGRSTVAAAKAIQKRDETGVIVDGMRAGELNVAQAAREAGFEGMAQGTSAPVRLAGEKNAAGHMQPTVYFGKGDKWQEATEPLRRYLTAHEKRGFHFGHVPPKEARKRVKTLDGLIEGLTAARVELEQRSHTYRLTA